MRGRELGDKRTQLGFCRSSRHRRLGAAGDLDFNLDGTASGGFFLHAHNGSLNAEVLAAGPFKSVARQGYADRKRVVWGKSVDLSGRRIVKKKRTTPNRLPSHHCPDLRTSTI